jgi:electron transport complex protein RnfC
MVRIKENKEYVQDKPIEVLPLPVRVYIPLIQHLGKVCNPEVKSGDLVKVGQRLAGLDSGLSALVHSSVSGKVVSLQDYAHPVLGRARAILIDRDSQPQDWQGSLRSEDEVSRLGKDEIARIVQEAGIVGMGGASFPTHIKLNPSKPVDTLIINAAECEPYLAADYRLMVEKTEEVFSGIKLVAKCLGVKNVYIGIEENKPQAIKKFLDDRSGFKVKVLESVYPQGGEKQLVQSILAKEIPRGKLPFDIGVVVQNIATVYAIYEAVYKNKPLYERVVSVTGSCLKNPKNLLVRIGTPIKELIDFCGPLKEEPVKMITGGPMMGISQFTDLVPVIKSTNGVLLLNKKESRILEEDVCIRCGACVRACPAGLMPCLINLAAEKGLWATAKDYAAIDCIECGLCSYVCPANRNLVQSIKMAKLKAGTIK